MEDESFEYFRNKKPDKTYITRSITDGFTPDDTNPANRRRIRIASKVFDTTESHQFVEMLDERRIHISSGRRQEVIAKFYEDNRGIFTLQIQRFDVRTGRPHREHFSFHGDEVLDLIEFILNVKQVHLPDSAGLNVTDQQLRKLLLSPLQARSLIVENPEVIAEALRSEVTPSDMIAIGYRKRQLKLYQELLADPETDEATWQNFFQENVWIFGYGLTYVFLSGLDQKKLEQAVIGKDLWDRGKRADAVLKTLGAISALCFVEIKKHSTPLLQSKAYRPSCWAPSEELAGAITQCQVTVEQVTRKALAQLEPLDESGEPTGERLFTYQPRSFLVVGSLDEFVSEGRIRRDHYRSFELLRRNVVRPEIVTFDELYERAKFIVEASDH